MFQHSYPSGSYKALRTPWRWQPYAETCRRGIWNVLIIKNPPLPWAFVGLVTNELFTCVWFSPQFICSFTLQNPVGALNNVWLAWRELQRQRHVATQNQTFFKLYTVHFCSVFPINQQMHCSDSSLTLCRFYLKPYCMGRKTAFFFSGHLIYILKQEHFRAFRPAGGV
jgi:hypothetical protein